MGTDDDGGRVAGRALRRRSGRRRERARDGAWLRADPRGGRRHGRHGDPTAIPCSSRARPRRRRRTSLPAVRGSPRWTRTGAARADAHRRRELLGRYGEGTGKIWLRVTQGGPSAGRGGPNLDVVEREADRGAPPDPRARPQPQHHAPERATGAVRTTTDDGRHSPTIRARGRLPSLRPGAARGITVGPKCGSPTDGCSRRWMARTERRELGSGAWTPAWQPPSPSAWRASTRARRSDELGASPMRPLQVGPHVLVLRRTSRADDAGLARVDVERGARCGRAPGRPRGRLVAAAVGRDRRSWSGRRHCAVDLTSGAVLWGRGRGTWPAPWATATDREPMDRATARTLRRGAAWR